MAGDPTRPVLCERAGVLGRATLNRPTALNALNLEMIRLLAPALETWAGDPAVAAVLVSGAGERSFCAGGDVRSVCEAGWAGDTATAVDFFAEEYRLNLQIARFPKPYIALLDGITMGGGVGLSVHGSHRIATEHTLLAMPETGIGLFPDVGASYFLTRLPGEVGTYLGLTGARVGPADLLELGLATHYVSATDLPQLEAALHHELAAQPPAGAARSSVDAVLARFTGDPGPPALGRHRREIDACFGASSVEAICAALRARATPWAVQTLGELERKSPTSLKVTLRQLRLGRSLDLEEALRMEYRLSQHLSRAQDFCEGVRAVLVAKDSAARWQPATLAAVDEATVAGYFTAPPPGGDLELRPAAG